MSTNSAYESDKRPYEIWNGEVYYMAEPSLPHNDVTGAIYTLFLNFLKGKRCKVYNDSTAVRFEDEDTTVVPDVSVVCDRSKLRYDKIYGAPDLVVEVYSPSTGAHDRKSKMALYERQGVKEYWIVTPQARTIERYVSEGGRFTLESHHAALADRDFLNMLADEKAAYNPEFKTSIFDDLVINVYDVFAGLEEE